MKKTNLIKLAMAAVVLTIGCVGFSCELRSEMQTIAPLETTRNILEGKEEVTGYQNWTKVNDTPKLMNPRISASCVRPTKEQAEREAASPHFDKYINVYVNEIGKDEMMKKKNPQFPKGTVIVKEKFSNPEKNAPELLTVMIKREKGFNPESGDWEFMTLNGDAAQVTARGKLESCQACHIAEKATDYISRNYLPNEVWKKLK